MTRKIATAGLTLSFLMIAAASGPDPAGLRAAETGTTVIYLVRHAEKAGTTGQDGPQGPPLSAAGRDRAQTLVEVLAAEEIAHIYSTDFRRTRETAEPLADQLGLKVESYDPRALEEFAAELRNLPGRHLVVGHSNTTPQLVEFLGGEPGEPIDEPTEYDRLYAVIIGNDGTVATLPLRYGEPPAGP